MNFAYTGTFDRLVTETALLLPFIALGITVNTQPIALVTLERIFTATSYFMAGQGAILGRQSSWAIITQSYEFLWTAAAGAKSRHISKYPFNAMLGVGADINGT